MRVASQLAFIALVLASTASTPAQTETPNETVRHELTRLQKQMGLMLVSYDTRSVLTFVLFGKKAEVEKTLLRGSERRNVAISRDGNEVAVAPRNAPQSDLLFVFSIDGSIRLEYPYSYHPNASARFGDLCWSNDKSKIAALVQTSDRGLLLQLLDLPSGITKDLATDAVGLTSQCWSPDGKKIVYEGNDGIRTMDLETEKSSLLVDEGVWPTWSSDGLWIAYLDHKTYRVIHPDGKGRKKFFRHHESYSPLYWSPDSRFVAYVNEGDFFPSLLFALSALDDAPSVLRIRRLADGATLTLGSGAGDHLQWVTNRDLLLSVDQNVRTGSR